VGGRGGRASRQKKVAPLCKQSAIREGSWAQNGEKRSHTKSSKSKKKCRKGGDPFQIREVKGEFGGGGRRGRLRAMNVKTYHSIHVQEWGRKNRDNDEKGKRVKMRAWGTKTQDRLLPGAFKTSLGERGPKTWLSVIWEGMVEERKSFRGVGRGKKRAGERKAAGRGNPLSWGKRFSKGKAHQGENTIEKPSQG